MCTYIIKSVCTLHIVLYFFYRVDIIWLLLDSMKMFLITYTSARVFATRGGPYTCRPFKKKMSQTGYSRPRAKILKPTN